MSKEKRASHFFKRIDVFDRILVFVAMVLFILLPSYILYNVNDSNYNFDTLMPCVIVLGAVVGTGVFTLYRPIRTTWFFFFECLIVLLTAFGAFEETGIDMPLSLSGILVAEDIYSGLGLAINLFFLFRLKRKSKSMLNENTHNDNAFDFLGGQEANKEIKPKIEQIADESNDGVPDNFGKGKFSRNVRIGTFIFAYLIFFIYEILLASRGLFFENQLSVICLEALLILLPLIFCSVIYPKDYKYIYYFNTLFFLMIAIISCRDADYGPLFFIIGIVAVSLSLLITLIVEGRTWTGAKPD